MTQVLLGSLVFTGLIMALVLVVLGARRLLLPQGLARNTVNGDRVLDAELGQKLLPALDHGGLHLPSSCGGAGTCGLCRVTVSSAGDALPVERSALGPAEIARGLRLACQVVVRGDLSLTIAESLLAAQSWSCTVSQTRTVAPLIKEIVFALPPDLDLHYRAGAYVEVTAPAFRLPFAQIEVAPRHQEAWARLGVKGLEAGAAAPLARAYSLANPPGAAAALVLNVRLALPPAGRPDVPPGVVSSWLFGLKVGDRIRMAGPFGDFFVMDTEREIVLIGGGVGMAPLHAIVLEQLEQRRTARRISFWYGARSVIDLFYEDEMARLAAEHPNFSWHVALSDPAPDDAWTGEVGFVHEFVHRQHLRGHADPGSCEYYLCGPPLMIEAVRAMLGRLRVPPENIRFDDFGG